MKWTEHNYLLLDNLLPEKKPVAETKIDIDPVKVIKYLSDERINAGVGQKQLKPTHERKQRVVKIIKEGYTRQEIKSVIDKKILELRGTELEHLLTPESIFKPSNWIRAVESLGGTSQKKEKNWMEK